MIKFEDQHFERGFGRYAVLVGRWQPGDLEAIKSSGVRELELNYVKGWEPSSLSFLEELPWLESFSITEHWLGDLEPIQSLKNLRSLSINTYNDKIKLDFSCFPRLEKLVLNPHGKGLDSCFERTTLKELFINLYRGKSSESFSSLTNLETLTLLSCSVHEVNSFAALSKAKYLRLELFRSLKSLHGFEGMSSLEELRLSNAPRIDDVVPLGNLPQLQRLSLDGLGTIQSIRPLENLRSLEIFSLGDTTVLDGDLSVLAGLPKLRYVGYTEKKHYTPRRKAWGKLLDPPNPANWYLPPALLPEYHNYN